MAIAQTIEKSTVDAAGYTVRKKRDDLGIVIVENPEGACELWERAHDYRGETITVDGEQYRFNRTWHGART